MFIKCMNLISSYVSPYLRRIPNFALLTMTTCYVVWITSLMKGPGAPIIHPIFDLGMCVLTMLLPFAALMSLDEEDLNAGLFELSNTGQLFYISMMLGGPLMAGGVISSFLRNLAWIKS